MTTPPPTKFIQNSDYCWLWYRLQYLHMLDTLYILEIFFVDFYNFTQYLEFSETVDILQLQVIKDLVYTYVNDYIIIIHQFLTKDYKINRSIFNKFSK